MYVIPLDVAISAQNYLMKYPETATFLNEDEKKCLTRMLREDSQGLSTHYDKKFVWQAMTDYKTYVQVGIYIGYI